MHDLSSTDGSISDGSTSGEARNITAPVAGKTDDKTIIQRANAVPIILIFNHYGLKPTQYNPKITCPFTNHKGGRERTPSLKYYADTNSFSCYGCGVAGGCVTLVEAMDKSNKLKAASKILRLFNSQVDEDLLLDVDSSADRLQMMADFSNIIREFRHNNLGNHAFLFIEHCCWVYDESNRKHKYDNEALRHLIESLTKIIEQYTPDLILSF
jgi:CHC2 zinc finger